MSKRYNIDERHVDKTQLAKSIRNYNAKITRTLKKNPGALGYLPEKMKMRDVKSEIKSKQDFTKLIKSTQRFLKPGAEKLKRNTAGLEITQWEYREVAIKVGVINRKRTIDYKKTALLDVVSEGTKLDVKRGEMLSVPMHQFNKKEFDFANMHPGKAWKKFKESVMMQSDRTYVSTLKEEYKRRYLAALRSTFGESRYTEELEKLTGELEKMSANTIYNMGFSNMQGSIKFISDPLVKDLIFDEIRTVWAKPGEEVVNFYEEPGEREINEEYYDLDDDTPDKSRIGQAKKTVKMKNMGDVEEKKRKRK